MTPLQTALKNVATANEALYAAIRETYPVGCECIYTKTDRGPGVTVKVRSWGGFGRLRVINEETGNVYWINGESSGLRTKPCVPNAKRVG